MNIYLRANIRKATIHLALVYFVFLMIVLAAAVYLNDLQHRHLADSLVRATRNSLVIRDLRQAVTVLEPAIDVSFVEISFVAADGRVIFALPAQISSEGSSGTFWLRTLEHKISTSTQTELGTVGTVRLRFNWLDAVSVPFAVWLAFLGFSVPIYRRLRSSIERRHQEILRVRESEVLATITKQVAHDIRSPLSALNLIVNSSLSDVSEEKRFIIRNATQRINDIANGLLQKAKADMNLFVEQTEPVMLVSVLDALTSEKRVQYREKCGLEILTDFSSAYGAFAKIDSVALARAVSNIVNNAVEAIDGSGRVVVSGRGYKDSVSIVISDNGKGIPSEIIAQLGRPGFSYGKEATIDAGSGLGLSHAREIVEGAQGKLTIQSGKNLGTMITLSFPRVSIPDWFVEKIVVARGSQIVSVDDEQTVHQIWASRLSKVDGNIQHQSFLSPKQFAMQFDLIREKETLFLVDFEFQGTSDTGFDAIERAGIVDRSILVTSRYDEPDVRTRARQLGVKILPKNLAAMIPIEIY